MGKVVSDTHIIGERGVIRFHDYCNNHFPYICFREVLRNDFGIDGEIELVKINDEGKKEMTGELLKVQIKSSSGSGYIKRRRDGTFSFSAKKSDLEYWSKYELGVLLIIYDDETESLFAKKIRKEDYLGAKKKSYPIDFSKENLLEKGKNDFVKTFSADFKTRVSFETPETIATNLLYIKQHPKKLYLYNSKYSTKKELFKKITNPNEAPYFVLYNKQIITGYNLTKNFKSFIDFAIEEDRPEIIQFEVIQKNQIYRRNLIELLNLMFKDFVSKKGIWYNRDYRRYYFSKSKESSERLIEKTSIKTGKKSQKKIVTFHQYGKDQFYRHNAFEVDYIFENESLFMLINPKYLFTTDGKTTLIPAKITKYTNYLTSREWNNQVLDQLYQVVNYITNTEHGIEVVNTEDVKFFLTSFIQQAVKFGIPSDIPLERTSRKKIAEEKANTENAKQTSFLK